MQLNKQQLIHILLPLLYQRGIDKINVDELGKKLYYYSNDPKFKKLFFEMQTNDDKKTIDFSYSINHEKQFGHVFENVNDSKIIGLDYDDFSLHNFGKNFGTFRLNLLLQLADQISFIKDIETSINSDAHIYCDNPNQEYYLVNGKTYLDSFNWELLTDGEVNSNVFLDYCKDTYYKNPNSNNKLMMLQESEARRIFLKDASYAVMQEKYNNQIRRIEIFTKSMDRNTLKEIGNISKTDYSSSTEILSDGAYVRKIKLK